MSHVSSHAYDVEQILGPFKAMLCAVVDPDELSENMMSTKRCSSLEKACSSTLMGWWRRIIVANALYVSLSLRRVTPGRYRCCEKSGVFPDPE